MLNVYGRPLTTGILEKLQVRYRPLKANCLHIRRFNLTHENVRQDYSRASTLRINTSSVRKGRRLNSYKAFKWLEGKKTWYTLNIRSTYKIM